MKKYLQNYLFTLIILFSININSQTKCEFKYDSVDKFTKTRRQQTSWEMIKLPKSLSFTKEEGSLSISSVILTDEEASLKYFWFKIDFMEHPFTLEKGCKITLLFKNEKRITLTKENKTEVCSVSKHSSGAYFKSLIMTNIQENEINEIIKNIVTDIRIEASDHNIDFTIKSKKNKKFKETLNCLL
ncbi:hypothetical protein Q4595_10365 [Wenyingzhuangia sp. 1_MG-2023]|nr:hypothetical protein [Wenyingzhuangia sp. 1_MG-2023]